eukprot:06610.XXX_350663_350854_1 [CDS] Oithona nana genome sequencing.
MQLCITSLKMSTSFVNAITSSNFVSLETHRIFKGDFCETLCIQRDSTQNPLSYHAYHLLFQVH